MNKVMSEKDGFSYDCEKYLDTKIVDMQKKKTHGQRRLKARERKHTHTYTQANKEKGRCKNGLTYWAIVTVFQRKKIILDTIV